MSVTKDSSTHSVQAETREGLSSAEKKAGFYLGKDGEWIPDGWTPRSLNSLTSKIGSGATPRGGKEAYKKEGISLIRSQNILDLKFEPNGLAFIDQAQADQLSNVEIEEDDVLINITGDSVARVCKVPLEFLPARVNQHVSIIRANKSESSPAFLEYLLVARQNKGDLLGLASAGATRNALTKSMLENFTRVVPSLPEQKAIAAVLSSLDDKIELLREQNETLEALAQTLFKRWFIDFNFPACMASPCAGKPVCKDYAEEAGSQIDHPRVRMECRHPELSVYGYKDFGGMPQPQEGSSAPDGQAGSSAPDGQAGSSAPDGQAGSSAPDGQAGSSAPDGQAGSSAPDGQAGKSFIYVLRLENGNRYVGMTDFLLRRYHEHKIGKGAKATKASSPVAMIHFEQFNSREEAAEREKWLKTGFGRKWLDREEEKGNLGAHVVQAPMIPSELGETPEGWKSDRIDSYVKLSGGGTPSTKESSYWDGGIPWTSPKDLSERPYPFLSKTNKTLTEEGLAKITSGLKPEGSLLLSSRAPIGYIAFTEMPVAVNQGYIAFEPGSDFTPQFMYLWLRCFMPKVINAANGSTFLEISKKAFKDIVTVVPDVDSLEKFGNVVHPIFEKMKFNLRQIETTTKLRDTLLPKLMKGEIRISL